MDEFQMRSVLYLKTVKRSLANEVKRKTQLFYQTKCSAGWKSSETKEKHIIA